jgi:methyl-accepting chemotaxis protein
MGWDMKDTVEVFTKIRSDAMELLSKIENSNKRAESLCHNPEGSPGHNAEAVAELTTLVEATSTALAASIVHVTTAVAVAEQGERFARHLAEQSAQLTKMIQELGDSVAYLANQSRRGGDHG